MDKVAGKKATVKREKTDYEEEGRIEAIGEEEPNVEKYAPGRVDRRGMVEEQVCEEEGVVGGA